MANFLKFVNEDIEAKKTLIASMPTKTKLNIKKYNNNINEIIDKYDAYEASVRKYIKMKSKKFELPEENNKTEKLSKKISRLEHVKFILNPLNSYLEKMGFDTLIYEISNYAELDFHSINKIIHQFLDKFEQTGIKLTKTDFEYTFYVNEYMNEFLEVRNRNKDCYDDIEKTFEKIYWLNPEIIEHIELNFRRLINKYERRFLKHIKKIQEKVLSENKVKNYQDCIKQLKKLYNDLSEDDTETVNDILNLSLTNKIDIETFFEDNKKRIASYNDLTIDSTVLNNTLEMKKFHKILTKLKSNLEEHRNYLKFLPLIDDFKKEYGKLIQTRGSESSVNQTLKSLKTEINKSEKILKHYNNKILGNKSFVLSASKYNIEELKLQSLTLAKELYSIHKKWDQEYIKSNIVNNFQRTSSIHDVLTFYYSFDYFKKEHLKKAFKIEEYQELINYSEEFDLFSMNLANVITTGINLFEETNVNKVIVNKYRLDNVNINEYQLNAEEIEELYNNVIFVLRINKIENSDSSIENIWFMTKVNKLVDQNK